MILSDTPYFVPGSEDYIYFSDEFILTNASQQAVAVISIVNDSLLEINETFRAEISLVLMEDRNCVLLLPSAADVTILDYDSELPFPIAFVFPEVITTNFLYSHSCHSWICRRQLFFY